MTNKEPILRIQLLRADPSSGAAGLYIHLARHATHIPAVPVNKRQTLRNYAPIPEHPPEPSIASSFGVTVSRTSHSSATSAYASKSFIICASKDRSRLPITAVGSGYWASRVTSHAPCDGP